MGECGDNLSRRIRECSDNSHGACASAAAMFYLCERAERRERVLPNIKSKIFFCSL
jgi:hypothetical protein